MFRPLPAGYDEEAACEALDPRKDVDGIGRTALARVFTGRGEGFAPCTAAACLGDARRIRHRPDGQKRRCRRSQPGGRASGFHDAALNAMPL